MGSRMTFVMLVGWFFFMVVALSSLTGIKEGEPAHAGLTAREHGGEVSCTE